MVLHEAVQRADADEASGDPVGYTLHPDMDKNSNACRLDWLDDVADLVHVRTSDGRLLYANQAARVLFGWPEADGMTPVDPGDSTDYQDIIRLCREQGTWAGNHVREDVHGNRVSLEARWSPIPSCSGMDGPAWFVYEINDASGRLLDENMVRAQRLESIGTLAGGVAHDINNVLGPILIGAEMIRRRVEDPWILKKLSGIEASAQRGAEIVKQVLDFSRGTEGEKIVVQPRYILKELVTFAEHTFSKSIRIVTDFSPELDTVVGDAALLRQMLLSLMVNARDAMPDGGTLTLAADNRSPEEAAAGRLPVQGHAGSWVRIRIRDTGIGIAAEDIDRIFEPFFTTKVRSQGTGLGLSTSLSIVRSHGGDITVDSTPGIGSEFSVWLPVLNVAEETTSLAPPPAVAAEPTEGEALRVLIVDDEPMMLEMNADLLESMGYRTATAEHGRAGLETFAADPTAFAVVVTDISMPVMNGGEMIRNIRKIRSDIPIIAVSGLSEKHHLSEGIGLDGIQVLQKPYGIDQLVTLIQEATSAMQPADDTLSDSGFERLFGHGDSW